MNYERKKRGSLFMKHRACANLIFKFQVNFLLLPAYVYHSICGNKYMS